MLGRSRDHKKAARPAFEWLEVRCLLSGGDVVINEIHYDPLDQTRRAEFIELYNTTGATVNLSGWHFDDGIEYTFPAGAQIESGRYVVVAEDPATMLADFGATAFGPWAGRLDGDGERIVLRNAEGDKEDQVEYKAEFPWPIAANGEGSSMELIDPSLDNDLGGSWRASGYDPSTQGVVARDLVPAESEDWRYRKGTSEASDPADAWRYAGFVEDGTWQTGQTPIGYGDGDDTTTLDDMRNHYSTVYLRHSFHMDSVVGLPDTLLLRVYVDDGCIVWINAREVQPRFSVTAGDKDHDDFAVNHEAAWMEADVPSDVLVAGENMLAVHVLNTVIGSSDLSIDAVLSIAGGGPFTPADPTPGERNTVYSPTAPPQVRQVHHAPQVAQTGEPITIAAKVTDPDGVGEVVLSYQLVLPGSYIPAYFPLDHDTLIADPQRPRDQNPAFFDPANWSTVVMIDAAGDGEYAATIPAQDLNRTLVRYRITARDAGGESVTAPYLDDPSLNFACYVYDGVPDYVAETRSVDPEGAGHVYDSEMLTSLPVYSLIARAADIEEMMAYDSSDELPQTADQAIRRAYNWQGAFVYDGVVYDHVDMRLRGANGRYHLAGKRSMRIRFNRGHYLQARDENGLAYPTQWRQLVVSKLFGNRLDVNYGLAETINNELWNLVGVPAPDTHWFHFRVVDGLEEVPAGANAQYYGDFWGMFMAFEPYDVGFLEARDLAKGNLYKLTNRVSSGELQQRYQAVDAPANSEDYNNIRSNLNAGRDEEWLQTYVNYDEWYRYHAVAEAVKHYDYWPGANKNMAWYFEPDDENPMGRLWYLPYDSDASWGPTWNAGEDEAKAAIYDSGGKPAMQIEYRNVIRTIRDLIFQPQVIEPWIDRTAAIIEDFWAADYDRWEDAPASAGTHNWNDHTLAWKVADMKKFAFVGGSWPGGSVGVGGQAAYLDQLAAAGGDATSIPDTPTVSYAGLAGYPSNGLVFETTAFSDPQGGGTFAAMEWRIAEVTDPDAPAYDPAEEVKFEWNAAWESGELTVFDDRIAVPAFAVGVGRTYRVRVRMKDNTGRWSHWSDPLELTTAEPDNVQGLLDNLRITELNYHPHAAGAADADLFEFIELRNVSADQTLDLTDVSFTAGVIFNFLTASVTSLGAGERVLVVRDEAAFETRYGTGANVAGAFDDSGLKDGGERIVLSVGGSAIHDFTYGDGEDDPWPAGADGDGSSLEVLDTGGDYSDWRNWRSSVDYLGSPGAAGSEPTVSVVVNEVLTHTDPPQVDSIELYNAADHPIDISGWQLSDSSDNFRKFTIPQDTVLGKGEYRIFNETQFNPSGGVDPEDFALDGAHGDDVWLLETDAQGELIRFVDHVEFGAAANGESFGRWPNGDGGVYPMTSTSLGQANPGPRVGPIVISEVYYNDGGDPLVDDLELVEVRNPTDEDVDLTDWRIRGGVEYDFPAGWIIARGGVLVILSFDPDKPENAQRLADFRTAYGIDASVALLGGYSGRLDNGGEAVRLERPDEPPPEEPDWIPHLLEDEVAYDHEAPWPTAADGGGKSLTRLAAGQWGNDPANWVAAAPSPGVAVDAAVMAVAAADIQFTTALSRFRSGASDSHLVRPAYPDAEQYIDVTNPRGAPLRLSEIRINAPDVTVDVALSADPGDDIVLQAGETRRFQLTYAPSLPTVADATTQAFDIADGLVIVSNAYDTPELSIALRGASTFNSDITYDGSVDLGELGTLNVNFGLTAANPAFDPTADINGDGAVNLGDLGPLNAEIGRQRSAGLGAVPGPSTPQVPAGAQPASDTAMADGTDGVGSADAAVAAMATALSAKLWLDGRLSAGREADLPDIAQPAADDVLRVPAESAGTGAATVDVPSAAAPRRVSSGRWDADRPRVDLDEGMDYSWRLVTLIGGPEDILTAVAQRPAAGQHD